MQARLTVAGAIVMAALNATSLAFIAFNIKPNIPWSWIALISGVIFIGLMFWILLTRQSQIITLQRQLSDRILLEKQKEHSAKIKVLIETWMQSLSIPKISEVELETASPMDVVKRNPRFDYLKAHLPSVKSARFAKLWRNYMDWDTKMQEYLDKCKRLRTAIQAAWKVDGTHLQSDFATPILEAIEGTKLHFWVILYGTGHSLDEVKHQILYVNRREVLYGVEVRNDNTYRDLKDDQCSGLILRVEYEKLAEQFSKPMIAAEVKQLSSDLSSLTLDIAKTLWSFLESAEYDKNLCNNCPIRPSASHKEGSQP